METDEEINERLKKMVATTQLRLALKTEEERRARLEHLSDNSIYIPNNLYLLPERVLRAERERYAGIVRIKQAQLAKVNQEACKSKRVLQAGRTKRT